MAASASSSLRMASARARFRSSASLCYKGGPGRAWLCPNHLIVALTVLAVWPSAVRVMATLP
jgi:hypothetical protein